MNKNYLRAIALAATAVAIMTTAAVPAFARVLTAGANASTSVSMGGIKVGAAMGATLAARVKDITTRADAEIARRIGALNALSTRVNAMVRLSATEKSALSTSIANQITAMNTLQTQIATDTAGNNTSSLKTDVQSITSSYRIFMLVLPQGAIEAASDRVLTIVGTMTDLGTKFSARISAAQTAGNNVTAANASLADFNAKISDASTQANAAASEVASLVPDNGNATTQASNTAALKGAHAKILAAQQDFVAARADAEAIIKDFLGFKGSATVNTTTTASTSTQ